MGLFDTITHGEPLTTNECFKLYTTTSDYLIYLRRDLENDFDEILASDARATVNILKRKCNMPRSNYRLDRQFEPIHELARKNGFL